MVNTNGQEKTSTEASGTETSGTQAVA